MNEHVELSQEPLDEVPLVAEFANGDKPVYVQDDSDYPVDPLDGYDGPGSSGCEVPAVTEVSQDGNV
jgi:hypothetical protein